jgi:hypothetical protein
MATVRRLLIEFASYILMLRKLTKSSSRSLFLRAGPKTQTLRHYNCVRVMQREILNKVDNAI